jgi:endonuclease YncB( thermonuclease family)
MKVLLISAVCFCLLNGVNQTREIESCLQDYKNDPCREVMFVDSCGMVIYQGDVIEIVDGQTIIVMLRKLTKVDTISGKTGYFKPKKEKIKLAGISVPKLDEPFSYKAKKMLSDLLLNKSVFLTAYCQSKNKELTMTVKSSEQDVALVLIKAGLALKSGSGLTAYQSCHYNLAQEQAKQSHLGMWQHRF